MIHGLLSSGLLFTPCVTQPYVQFSCGFINSQQACKLFDPVAVHGPGMSRTNHTSGPPRLLWTPYCNQHIVSST